MGKFIDAFRAKINANDTHIERAQFQTFMTGPEWRNVHMAEEYAAFLKGGEERPAKPFYQFPFFQQIKVFWQVFADSYRAARKHSTHTEIIFSEHMLMSLFIGFFTTVEYTAKGFGALFLWPFLPKENATDFQQYVAKDIVQDYADFIHHTPFYNYSYFKKIGPMWRAWWQSSSKSVADLVTAIMVSMDFIAKGILSLPVGGWYNQEANKEIETIDVVVKTSEDSDTSAEDFKHELYQKLRAVNGKLDEHEQFQIVQTEGTDNISSRRTDRDGKTPKHRVYAYAHLRLPRYIPFNKILKLFAKEGINARLIAGQSHIQIRMMIQSQKQAELSQIERRISDIIYEDEPVAEDRKAKTALASSYVNHTGDGTTFFAFSVPTPKLARVIEDIEQDKDLVPTSHFHDF